MLPIISNEQIVEIEKLKQSCLNKDNVVPVGLLYTDDFKEAVNNWPVLFHPDYWEAIITGIKNHIPNCFVVRQSDAIDCITIDDDNAPIRGCDFKRGKLINENLHQYGKRVYDYAVSEGKNIVYIHFTSILGIPEIKIL